MRYYISWTHSDPVYHQVIANLGVLISHPNVSQTWTIAAWEHPVPALFLDSGAYQYAKSNRSIDPAVVLQRQLALLGDTPVPTRCCHLDVPMMGTREPMILQARVRQNLTYAQWLMDHRSLLPAHVQPVGVIQACSVEQTYLVAQALADMGYESFALGSMAGMVGSKRDEVMRRVEAAVEAIGSALHVFGVSSFTVLEDLARLGITSIDSGTPMHEAWRGGILYSQPLRRYKIASPHFQEWRRNYTFAELIHEPLPCQCPVCRVDPQQIMPIRGKQWINLRAIHNCYHLVQALEHTMASF